MDKLLSVKVQTPRSIIFEGQAQAVASEDTRGPFSIIPEHANFLAIISNSPILIIKSDGSKLSIPVNQAIIHNFQDNVSIYVDPISSSPDKKS
jgi:F0F1-type ATP synthase epsilon subunit